MADFALGAAQQESASLALGIDRSSISKWEMIDYSLHMIGMCLQGQLQIGKEIRFVIIIFTLFF